MDPGRKDPDPSRTQTNGLEDSLKSYLNNLSTSTRRIEET